jgi:hypothetical protein
MAKRLEEYIAKKFRLSVAKTKGRCLAKVISSNYYLSEISEANDNELDVC